MVSHLFSYQLAVLALAWLFGMLHVTESKPGLPAPPMPAQPKRPRSTEPKPFAGLTQRPPCALCERETVHPNPSAPVGRVPAICGYLSLSRLWYAVPPTKGGTPDGQYTVCRCAGAPLSIPGCDQLDAQGVSTVSPTLRDGVPRPSRRVAPRSKKPRGEELTLARQRHF